MRDERREAKAQGQGRGGVAPVCWEEKAWELVPAEVLVPLSQNVWGVQWNGPMARWICIVCEEKRLGEQQSKRNSCSVCVCEIAQAWASGAQAVGSRKLEKWAGGEGLATDLQT